MAVYTKITDAELSAFMHPYRLGEVIAWRAITAGITNTNFYVETNLGCYVLTLFEQLSVAQVRPYIQFVQALHQAGVTCPKVVMKPGQDTWCAKTLAGKPAVLQAYLAGSACDQPTPQQCADLGRTVARFHLASQDIALELPETRGAQWRHMTAQSVLPLMDSVQASALTTLLQQVSQADFQHLPQANIHTDLFRDNVLFVGDAVSAVLDFYYAQTGPLLFDLAVCALEWCVDEGYQVLSAQWDHLRSGYTSVRQLTSAEADTWQVTLRAAIARFWLSRLYDYHHPPASAQAIAKDPTHFFKLLPLCGQFTW